MVEAKSHTKELVSSSDAKKPDSQSLICSSLAQTKRFVGSKSAASVDWTIGVYQYANRLAHLYLLHMLNGLDSYLCLLYFLAENEMQSGDTSVPSSKLEW